MSQRDKAAEKDLRGVKVALKAINKANDRNSIRGQQSDAVRGEGLVKRRGGKRGKEQTSKESAISVAT